MDMENKKKCVVCETELQGNQKKFCSNTCKQKDHWHRVSKQPNTYHSQTIRSYKRKIELIKMSGGGCKECGYNENIAALQFHHRNANEKSFQLDARNLSNRKWGDLLEEHSKCDLLCANCHLEHHNPEMEFDNVELILESYETDKIVNKKKVNKPKCCDCGVEVNYGSKRCTSCRAKSDRKVERPNLELLKEEKYDKGVTWCSKKYGVSRRTINRWIENGIQ